MATQWNSTGSVAGTDTITSLNPLSKVLVQTVTTNLTLSTTWQSVATVTLNFKGPWIIEASVGESFSGVSLATSNTGCMHHLYSTTNSSVLTDSYRTGYFVGPTGAPTGIVGGGYALQWYVVNGTENNAIVWRAALNNSLSSGSWVVCGTAYQSQLIARYIG